MNTFKVEVSDKDTRTFAAAKILIQNGELLVVDDAGVLASFAKGRWLSAVNSEFSTVLKSSNFISM